MAPEIPQPDSQLLLDKVEVGVTRTMVLMLCRMWDVHGLTGHYLSTDFVVCDAKGTTMHATARSTITHNFLRLKDGGEYSVKNFAVHPNKDEFRVFKNDTFMLEFDGGTTFRKAIGKPNGFIRYPFQFVEFDNLELTNNKYMIDAVGYVTNVGRTVHQKSGSKTLDFYLANSRGQAILVTMWGSLGEKLIEKRTSHAGMYPIVLTCVTVKLYNGQLYLSSTSSTLILNDEGIPELKQLRADTSGAEFSKEILPLSCSDAKAGTLENLLMWARNRKDDSAIFHCTVNIDNVRTKNGWNFPSCGGEKCKKSVTRSGGQFLCKSYNKTVDYLVLRYRLELEVSDDTAEVVVVMFNETATSLVKCTTDSIVEIDDQDDEDHSPLPHALANIIGTTHTLEFRSQTYYEHGLYESFTCWRIVTAEGMGESGGSSAANAHPAFETPELKWSSRHPSVPTPSKTGETSKHKRVELEDSDTEASSVAVTQTGSGVGAVRPNTRNNKRSRNVNASALD